MWIAVADNLPEHRSIVLLFGACGNTYLGRWLDSKKVFTEMDGGRLHSITHWMPLPEPPK